MSPRPDTWMPLYIADYMADTSHLSAELHGSYLLLLMGCWKRRGALPNDEVKLARIALQSPAGWRRHRATLLEFFVLDGDTYTHKRVSAELSRAQIITEKRRQSGAKGGRPRRQMESKPKANGLQTETPSQSQDRSLAPIGPERSIRDMAPPSPSPAEGQATAAPFDVEAYVAQVTAKLKAQEEADVVTAA